MIKELMRVGDEVAITIPKENRDWGYNPCPDGTKAVILGFSEIHYGRLDNFSFKPGVYVNRAWVKVRLPDGKEYSESAGRLELTDKVEYKRRLDEFRKLLQEQPDKDNKEFLLDLPETTFWESDKVQVRFPQGDSHEMTIERIDYASMYNRCNDGSPWPFYSVRYADGGTSGAKESWIELIERGPVWKFYHDEPITFSNLKEEVQFFASLGHTEEVRNPTNGLYKWTKEEVLEAIRSGIVHGFSVDGGLFRTGPHIRAKRFKNEELGKRVAKATLEGFGIVV